MTDEKREELKGFVVLDEASLSKSYQKFCYSQNQEGSEFSNRMNEQKKNLMKDLMNNTKTIRRLRP